MTSAHRQELPRFDQWEHAQLALWAQYAYNLLCLKQEQLMESQRKLRAALDELEHRINADDWR